MDRVFFLPFVLFYFTLLCFALLSLLCFALLCFALLCFALLCFALLCFALLCFALLCFALLCFALLCFALLTIFRCCWPQLIQKSVFVLPVGLCRRMGSTRCTPNTRLIIMFKNILNTISAKILEIIWDIQPEPKKYTFL